MASVAQPGQIYEPPSRHGVCRLTLSIGGQRYALRQSPGQPEGMCVYALHSVNGERAGKRYCVALVHDELGCTCPDHEVNGASCKHINALRALGLVPRAARTAAEARAIQARAQAGPPIVTATPAAPAAGAPKGATRAQRRRHTPQLPSPQPPASPRTEWHQAVTAHVAQLAGGAA